MHVRADDAPPHAALAAVLAVVAAAVRDAPERRDAGAEARAPGVVLEADEALGAAAGQVAVDDHVADRARVAGERLEVDEARARDLVALVAAVAVAEQLVAAADGEQRRAVVERRAQRGRLAQELLGDEHLVAILPAADQDQVRRARIDVLAERHGRDLDRHAAPARALLEHAHVAAVGVDREQLRVERHDAHGTRHAPSQ